MGRRPYAIWKRRYVNLVSLLATGLNHGLEKAQWWEPPHKTLPLRLQPQCVTVSYFLVRRGLPFSSTPVLVTGPMPTNSSTAGSPPALAPSQCTVLARSMAKVPAGNG